MPGQILTVCSVALLVVFGAMAAYVLQRRKSKLNPVVNILGRNKAIPVPTSPRTGGYEYVWHCHILEHEEHDMMRPLVVF